MNSQQPSQELLLDYLYGLLDDAENERVAQCLDTSDDWRQALEQAKQHQQVFSDAAQTSFEGVRFEPPVKVTQIQQPADTQTKSIAIRRTWTQWALAASILLLVCFGGGAAAGLSWYSYYADWANKNQQYAALQKKHNDAISQRQQAQMDTQNDIRQMQDQIKELEQKWKGDVQKVQAELGKKNLQVIVSGPQTIQAGARNQYRIETRNRVGARGKGQLAPSQVEVQVIDPAAPAANQVLYRTKIDNQVGACNVDLPRDLPVVPGKQLQLQVVALGNAGIKTQVSEKLPLVGRLYLTHLTTDRPMYRPGEVVRFRSLTLDRFNLKPPAEPFALDFTILGPRGNKVFQQRGTTHLVDADKNNAVIKGPDGQPVHGIGAGEFAIPNHLPGGEYTLVVREEAKKFPDEKRSFIINRYQAPRLNKELVFKRKSYGPGDDVRVDCKVSPVAGGKAIANQPVVLQAYVDGNGQPFVTKNMLTDNDGKVTIGFTLPKEIKRGGTVSVTFRDNAGPESLIRPIPIVLDKLHVDFYPEGGDLIAGVPNRVYFEARTPAGKPAELKGRIVDQNSKVVARIETFNDDDEPGVNQGMGSFRVTPKAGMRYRLEIDSPIGIKSKHLLPIEKSDGVLVHCSRGVVTDAVELTVTSVAKERELLVGAYCRGRLMAHTTLTAAAGKELPVTLKLTEPVSGVYRVTVFEVRQAANDQRHLLPKAERLIYRRPVEKLNIALETDKEVYSPGERVKLKIATTDENKKKQPAVLLISAVDQRIIKLADDKTARSMPTHFYLTTEIKSPEELEYADFLVKDDPKAEIALDLLLGTQGWRRFVEQDPKIAVKRKQNNDVNRLMVLSGQVNNAKDLSRQAQLRVDQQYAPPWQQKQEKLASLEQKSGEVTTALRQAQQQQRQALSVARNADNIALRELRQHQATLFQIGVAVLACALLLAAVIGVIVGMMRTSAEQSGGSAFLLLGMLSFMLFFAIAGGGAVYFLGSGFRTLREEWGMEEAKVAMNAAPMMDQAGAMGGDDGAVDAKAEMGAPGGAMPMAPGAVGGMPPPAPMPPNAMPKPKRGGEPGAAIAKAPPRDLNGGGNELALNAQVDRQAKRPVRGGFGGRGAAMADMPPMDADMELGEMNRFRFARDQQLRQGGRFQELARRRLNRQPLYKLQSQKVPFVVREFAHKNLRDADGARSDFAETIYWHPVLVTADGKGEVSFDLSDSVTTFRVLAWGHSLNGRLGATKTEIVSRLPFSVHPKIPQEINNNDKISIPVAIANETGEAQTVEVTVTAENLEVIGDNKQTISVGPDGGRCLFTFRPSKNKAVAKLQVTGHCAKFGKDRVEEVFSIVPEGFPNTIVKSDVLEGAAVHTVTLPESWVKGSLQLRVQVFPSTLADLQKGLEGMLREPHGCFEQTSSSNYPNVMILSYLKETEQASPELEKTARGKLTRGYGKLVSFECRDPKDQDKRGYEWFGGTAAPHEALTAYGLLQFGDMAKIQPVDKKMMERTEKYLLDARDGNGGFKRNKRALDSFGRAPDHITDAYIVWALTEYGTKADMTKELSALQEKAKDAKDPYFLSLVGLGLLNAGKDKDALAIFDRMRDMQKDDGHLEGGATSITSSRGKTLHIETTALALLGWLKANRPGNYGQSVRKAAAWIGKQRGGHGGYGSTQSTILALKALIAYTRENRKTADEGEIKLYLNDSKKPIDTLWFPAGHKGELIVSVPNEDMLKPGKNKISVEMTGKNTFPYTLTCAYNTLKPVNAEKCPVQLTTRLNRNSAKEGETVRITATVANKSGKGQGMAVAVIGLPAGLIVPEDLKQLKQMTQLRDNGTKPGEIGAFEINGRELVLYWRSLAPKQTLNVTVDLKCRTPGEFRGPASRAYLYYQSDLKYWCEPLAMTIQDAK